MPKKSKRLRRAETAFKKQVALITEREALLLEKILRQTEDPKYIGLARTLRTIREAERIDQEESDSQQEMFKVEACKGYMTSPLIKRMF